jgi:hypothetical protein
MFFETSRETEAAIIQQGIGLNKGQIAIPWRALALIFAVAVMVNYIWVLAQAPFYVGLEYSPAMFWHCFVASLGDGVMVLLIVSAGWLTSKGSDWFVRPGLVGYIVMTLSGFFLAVLVEWVAVHILNRWQYAEDMPRLPSIDIGLTPIAQMLILPPLIFWIAMQMNSKNLNTDSEV